MDTKITNQYATEEVAQLLRKGEVVAFPTETVYGLGANALDSDAVQKIFWAKGRPSDNPLNVLVSTKEDMYALAEHVPHYVEPLIKAFSPGPITYVLQSAGKVAKEVSASLTTIGVRIPNHPVALRILEETGLPLAAPSANVSGRPSPTTADHVMHDLMGKVAAIVDGGQTNVGLESTVVDCTGEVPTILRSGLITAEDIKEVVGACDIASVPKMPSNKYKHYAPNVPLILTFTNAQFNQVILDEKAAGKRIAVIVPDEFPDIDVEEIYRLGKDKEETARNLYNVLRAFDDSKIDVVISTSFKSKLVMDRLSQAATKVM